MVPSPHDGMLNRRAMLTAIGLGAVGAVAGCGGGPASAPSSSADADDGNFLRPVPHREGAEDESPTGEYSVAAPRRNAYPVSSGQWSASNVGDLYLPNGLSGPLPVLVMIHGGGWTKSIGLSYMGALARDAASCGVAVWNVEYRRVHGGGGWPTTFTDVAAAVDYVPHLSVPGGPRIDPSSVHVTGHSAGGHLAAWAAGRHKLPPGAPGATREQRLSSATIMAGVFDLALADDHRRDRFVHGLLGGSDDEVPDRYRIASPINHLPTGIPVTCLHGTADTVVLPEQSHNYVRGATAAGDPARLVLLPNVNHTAFGDITSPAWRTARDHILKATERGPSCPFSLNLGHNTASDLRCPRLNENRSGRPCH